MSKKVPFKNSFDKAKRLDAWSNRLIWISAFLFLIVFVGKLFSLNSTIIQWIERVNCIVIFIYIVLEFVTDCIHSSAEAHRRCDLVDNAFGCKLAESRSEGYYTNDELKNGLYKIGVNSFESCFFSYKIASKSQCLLWVKSALFALLFIICAVIGYDKGIVVLIQLSLPLFVISHAIRQQRFVSRLKKTYDNYRSVFDTLRNKKSISQNDYAKIMKEVLEYEGTISWANILLDEKTYNEMNEALSKEWEQMKKDYKIIDLNSSCKCNSWEEA